jgi:hypothetical protein
MESLFTKSFGGNVGLKHLNMNAVARMQAKKHTGDDLSQKNSLKCESAAKSTHHSGRSR